MNRNPEKAETPVQPPLSQMFAQYLERQMSAQAAGLALPATGEVVPHEAGPVQPIDPKLAWEESLAALRCYQPALKPRSLKAAPDWPALVASHEPVAALAFAAGNFPQLVRNLQPLLQGADLTTLRAPALRPLTATGLQEWAAQATHYPEVLVAVGALRLARQFEAAAELLRSQQDKVPAEWDAAVRNEEAALAWHRGRSEEALALWQAQPASVPVLFNRGMAALFLGRPAEAIPHLRQAVEQLPESSAWHHLGRLYLALAEMRR
jgi:tetratricopeptide (TPR) repeat protein